MAQNKGQKSTVDRELKRAGSMVVVLLGVAVLWKTGVFGFVAGKFVNHSISSMQKAGAAQKASGQQD